MRYFMILLTLLLATGCLDQGGGTVEGTVMGSTFDIASGSAERSGGSFIITLSDSSEFTCSSLGALPESYLTIDITEVTEETEYDASGTVYFNTFADSIADGEAATSGTVTIDSIDETMGRIEGTIDAAGPNSSVSGTFAIDICS